MFCGTSNEVFGVVAAGNGSLSAAAFAVAVRSSLLSAPLPTFAEASSRSVGVVAVLGMCGAMNSSCSIAEMGSEEACVAIAAEGVGSDHCGWSTLSMAPVTIVCEQGDDCSERVHVK